MPTLQRLSLLATAALLAACGTTGGSSAPRATFMQDGLPEAVRVPAGHRVVMETTTANGEITYECRDRANMPGQTEWVFAGPKADLLDRGGRKVGTYYGPPATWESTDGSKLTGTQLAVAPAGDGNIPLQLVKANPAMGSGAMTGISHIQRVNLRGGVAPASPCTTDTRGKREVVKYQADYIFYKPAM